MRFRVLSIKNAANAFRLCHRFVRAITPYWVRQFFSDVKGHGRAFAEVAVVTAFTLLPFAVAYLVDVSRRPVDFYQTQAALLGRGQLYLLAYSVFGTVFWLAFVRWDYARTGIRTLLGFLATLAIFPVVGFMGVDPTFSTVVDQDIIRVSYYYYFGMVILNYLLLFYMGKPPPAVDAILNDSTTDLAGKFHARGISE